MEPRGRAPIGDLERSPQKAKKLSKFSVLKLLFFTVTQCMQMAMYSLMVMLTVTCMSCNGRTPQIIVNSQRMVFKQSLPFPCIIVYILSKKS